jgi:abortive infection bacteriophage resistance protein
MWVAVFGEFRLPGNVPGYYTNPPANTTVNQSWKQSHHCLNRPLMQPGSWQLYRHYRSTANLRHHFYHLSHEISPWWFEDSANFKNAVDHTGTLLAIDRELGLTKEVFIKEHYKKYHTDTRKPPAWKTLEVASLGNISKLYGNLLSAIPAKDTIAAEMGNINHSYLPGWLQSITQIRNICAHHGRLWNKNLPGRPKLLPNPPYAWIADVPPVSEHHLLYIHLCCIKHLLDRVNPINQFSQEFLTLLQQYPNIDPNALGLKPEWQNEPLWRT